MSSAIEVTGLDKHFDDFHAVKDVSFKAEQGGITALLGPSGSGKSTVLRMIAGLERPDEGHILLGGKELTNKSVQERSVGFVFQHYALFRHMSVWDNVAFGLDVRKESKSTIRRRVDELLHLVQLAPFASRYPDNLSGGQRQRVALARALAPRPEVLLLDEPFGALDARVRQDLRRWLDELHREIGVTSLLVTHDQEEALELANKVVVMHEGGIEQIGTPDEIYNEPATPFIAGFVGAANVLHGFVINGQVQFGDSFLPEDGGLPDGATAEAFVRPHDIEIAHARSDRSICEATIHRVSNLGWLSKVLLKLDDGQVIVAQIPNDRFDGFGSGDRVFVDLDRANVFSTGEGPDASSELAAI